MPQKKVHLLLVDDDPFFLRLFSSQLSDFGFEIILAHDGGEGREMARRFLPDLILTDQDMPVMDGLELITRLKSEEITKNIPIILLTNKDLSIEAEKWSKQLGVSDYIHKSTLAKDVVERINKILK